MAVFFRKLFVGMGSGLSRSLRLPERLRRFQWVVWLFLAYILIATVLGMYWSFEPKAFDVQDLGTLKEEQLVTGTTTTATLIRISETLLEKPGGYLSNDIAPPGIWLDNMPNWEYGVLVQIRDMSKVMRETLSRSQSQSIENKFLIQAEPSFHFHNDSWILPSSESKYREAIKALKKYNASLADSGNSQAQFYARADNLRNWLFTVESRLGSLSQRLSASVGQRRLNTDTSSKSTPQAKEVIAKTPWLKIDDNLYEARGTAWALVHLLKAIEVDFASVLEKKNASVSLQQIIRELEASIESLDSPIVLNGSGFGLLANHSLVMASYLSRANAAITDLRELLAKG